MANTILIFGTYTTDKNSVNRYVVSIYGQTEERPTVWLIKNDVIPASNIIELVNKCKDIYRSHYGQNLTAIGAFYELIDQNHRLIK